MPDSYFVTTNLFEGAELGTLSDLPAEVFTEEALAKKG
jgi:hypothetical protein